MSESIIRPHAYQSAGKVGVCRLCLAPESHPAHQDHPIRQLIPQSERTPEQRRRIAAAMAHGICRDCGRLVAQDKLGRFVHLSDRREQEARQYDAGMAGDKDAQLPATTAEFTARVRGILDRP